MNQTTEIRRLLESGEAITPIEALDKFGCFRLAARIRELRADGMAIATERVEEGGKTFARYRAG